MSWSWYVYLAQCKDGTLYCGVCTDLDRRMKVHNMGRGSQYCRSRLPVKLVWSQRCAHQGSAQRWESYIKKWPRKKKLILVNEQLRVTRR